MKAKTPHTKTESTMLPQAKTASYESSGRSQSQPIYIILGFFQSHAGQLAIALDRLNFPSLLGQGVNLGQVADAGRLLDVGGWVCRQRSGGSHALHIVLGFFHPQAG